MKSRCPICKKVVQWPKASEKPAQQWVPFCSERCKLIDLGKWLDSDYRIPVKQDENEDSDEAYGSDSEKV
jgi:uncharacterized protein